VQEVTFSGAFAAFGVSDNDLIEIKPTVEKVRQISIFAMFCRMHQCLTKNSKKEHYDL
jgi:hypothetical protein